MVAPLTVKLDTLIYHPRNRNYKFVNNNKQPQAKRLLNGVSSYNLLMVGPLTIHLGALMYHDKSSPKKKLQGCKQQQTA